MDSWERFNETSLPPKESFYSELNLEDISGKDYLHAQKVWDVFEIRNLGEYHDLYVQTDTLLLADVYEKFRDKCIEIYGLDPSYFLSAPGLAWQACLKMAKVNLELLTDIDMLLMIESGIRGGTCQSIHRYAEANNKYMKNYNDLSRFNENFIRNYDENSDVGYFLEVDIEYPKQLWSSHKVLLFLPKRKKLEKVEKLVCSIEDKENMSYT